MKKTTPIVKQERVKTRRWKHQRAHEANRQNFSFEVKMKTAVWLGRGFHNCAAFPRELINAIRIGGLLRIISLHCLFTLSRRMARDQTRANSRRNHADRRSGANLPRRKLRRAPHTALHTQRSILPGVASFRSVAAFPIGSLTNSGVAAAAFQIKIQGELKRKRDEERNLPEIPGRSDVL